MADTRENVRAFILDKGYKHTIIAKKAKLTPAKLSGIINKSRRLEVDEFFSLCEAMEVTPDELRNYKGLIDHCMT